jgi:tetraacyldisaccharide 4'-kinase
VAELLRQAGKRPFLISRGYGGSLRGPLRVDPKRHRAREVGDEAFLLARAAPTIVGADRRASAEMARVEGADAIVMDDGFQNPALAKNLSLIVIDGRRGIGNGAVFPAGPLRAPLAAQLDRAHAVLVIGPGSGVERVVAQARARALPIFNGRLVPDTDALTVLAGRRVLAYAGIGDPEKIFATLAAAGVDVAARRIFPDHHRYGRGEAFDLVAQAERDGLTLVTTEKDLMRLNGEDDVAALASRTRALPVKLVVDEQTAFRGLVLKAAG